MFFYEIGQTTRIGDRDVNEDAVAVARRDDAVLMVVADGLGAHGRGDFAAAILVETFMNNFAVTNLANLDPAAFLDDCVEQAHQTILHEGVKQQPPLRPLTTCVACLVRDGQVWCSHTGDSRFYLFRDGTVHHCTDDHTHAAFMLRQGLMDAAEAAVHPLRNRLYQCVGGPKLAPSPVPGGPWQLGQGDVVLVCSDGLWSSLDDAVLAATLADNAPQAALECLAAQAEAAGRPGCDNISAAALRVSR